MKKLLGRFKELLNTADRVDLASAWATEGEALNALKNAKMRKHPVRVRALIGLRGNSTTPDALDMLKKIGELRIVNENRLFHPKVYLFRLREGDQLAWVGSANFTGGGFENNEEVVFETPATQQIADWFDNRWEAAGQLDGNELLEYKERYLPPGSHWWDERPRSASRSTTGEDSYTPSSMFREPILQVLRILGGSGSRQNVHRGVYELMKRNLKDADYKPYEPNPRLKRWQQSMDEARYRLATQGVIKRPPDVTRGTWELTELSGN